MNGHRGILLGVAAAMLLFCAVGIADQVTLTSGRVITGKVQEGTDIVRIETAEGILTVPVWRVKGVTIGDDEVAAQPAASPAEAGEAPQPQLRKPLSERLPLLQRKRVYVLLTKAEDEAYRQAVGDYPHSMLKPGYTRQDLEQLAALRVQAEVTYLEAERARIAAEHNLSAEDIAQILSDADKENWPKS